MNKQRRKRLRKRQKISQIKALKSNRRFKAFTRNQNRYKRRRNQSFKRIRSEHTGYKNALRKEEAILPDIFTINDNLEGVLNFIYKSKKILERRKVHQVDFDFKNVRKVDDGAATMLLSICSDMDSKGIRVRANQPLEPNAREFIIKSGFMQYFEGPHRKLKSELLNMTIKKGKTKIEQKDSAGLIHKSMKTVFTEKADLRNQKLQGMLIELMTNSVNHAYLNDQREKTWYISTSHYPNQNKVEFCFVDNGDGIINTINVKFRLLIDNVEILKNAFNGDYRSRTKLRNRGRGLVAVKDSHTKMTIRGLKVITNNVFLDFENNVTFKLATPFSGTFYSWILDKSCKQ
ncbi:hypothetical protein [Mucilaginibacter sp.]|jgi:anti-sigma regulatory factor (Ser/Thr protein kinase)|uniref:hypothetical protein n=1 Tax=Mucilaginibacter sp. TaxID=1882438 RepID=UPI002BEB8AC6|nr:hypothetical protein [Mucilaginibacter sp.]HTI59241.1 hypothetical protein [Mucilaginibacter sp.]